MQESRFREAASQYSDLIEFITPSLQEPGYLALTRHFSVFLQRGTAYLALAELDKAIENANLHEKTLCPILFCSELGEGLAGTDQTTEFRGDVDMQRRQYARAKRYYDRAIKSHAGSIEWGRQAEPKLDPKIRPAQRKTHFRT